MTDQPEPVVSIHGARDLTPETREAVEALIAVAKAQITQPSDDNGPSVREAAANDRVWDLERYGE